MDCGFNLVGMANNHTLDRGEPSLQNSLKYWSDKDVYTAVVIQLLKIEMI